MNDRRGLVASAYLIYVISWLLPVHANGVQFPRGLPGWQAFVVALTAPWESQVLNRDLWWWFLAVSSVLSALTNVLMLLSVPVLLIGARRGTRLLACFAAAAWLVNAVWIIAPDRDQLRVGYYLWWTSFAILAAAASHHVWSRQGDMETDAGTPNKPMRGSNGIGRNCSGESLLAAPGSVSFTHYCDMR